ncbi:MAG TPA: YncE family protein [Vicinamibacterales bacterium]|nr:YncE family protein [Vicinamibacterales bacterium]
MGRKRLAALGFLAMAACADPVAAQQRTYFVYVASEAADTIALVRFGPDGIAVDHEIATGMMPTDIDGPHGLAVSPDKAYYYVSIAHGQPNGSVWKYSTKDDKLVGRVSLGMFPATLDVAPDGDFLFVVNFNLHGDMVPSSVSVVTPEDMTEIARIPTCTMPHGSRLNADGSRHYSVCMMDEQLVEIDTATLKTSRHFILTRGREAGMNGPPMRMQRDHTSASTSGHGTEAPAAGDISCSPTWAQPSKTTASVFVACNGSSEIVEVSLHEWKLVRRIPAGPGVYNLGMTRDGRLIATNRRDQSVSVFDVESGKELARVRTRRKVVHGVAVAPDDRYAFISVEGIASEPGTVEVLDLKSLTMVASVDVGPQAGGIDVLRTVDR